MTDPQTQAWLDQEDANVSAIIRRHGWFIQYVGSEGCSHPDCGCEPGEGPPFAYTIGLFGLGHPELLIIGVPIGTAHGVLNDLGERIRGGADLVAGELITFDGWPHRIIPEPVPNPGDIVFGANRHYQRPPVFSVPALQLSYDDKAGRFRGKTPTPRPRCSPAQGRSIPADEEQPACLPSPTCRCAGSSPARRRCRRRASGPASPALPPGDR